MVRRLLVIKHCSFVIVAILFILLCAVPHSVNYWYVRKMYSGIQVLLCEGI